MKISRPYDLSGFSIILSDRYRKMSKRYYRLNKLYLVKMSGGSFPSDEGMIQRQKAVNPLSEPIVFNKDKINE